MATILDEDPRIARGGVKIGLGCVVAAFLMFVPPQQEWTTWRTILFVHLGATGSYVAIRSMAALWRARRRSGVEGP